MTVLIIDTNIGEVYDSTSLLFKNTVSNIYKTIEQKDNTLFLGNYKELTRLINLSHIVKLQELEIIESVKSTVSSDSSYTRFFKKGESYLLGIVLVTTSGEYSNVIYIGEAKPTHEPGVDGLSLFLVLITEDISLLLLNNNIQGIIPVRAINTLPNILCQGFLSTTMTEQHNNPDRILASWYYRPYLEAINFNKFPLTASTNWLKVEGTTGVRPVYRTTWVGSLAANIKVDGGGSGYGSPTGVRSLFIDHRYWGIVGRRIVCKDLGNTNTPYWLSEGDYYEQKEISWHTQSKDIHSIGAPETQSAYSEDYITDNYYTNTSLLTLHSLDIEQGDFIMPSSFSSMKLVGVKTIMKGAILVKDEYGNYVPSMDKYGSNYIELLLNGKSPYSKIELTYFDSCNTPFTSAWAWYGFLPAAETTTESVSNKLYAKYYARFPIFLWQRAAMGAEDALESTKDWTIKTKKILSEISFFISDYPSSWSNGYRVIGGGVHNIDKEICSISDALITTDLDMLKVGNRIYVNNPNYIETVPFESPYIVPCTNPLGWSVYGSDGTDLSIKLKTHESAIFLKSLTDDTQISGYIIRVPRTKGGETGYDGIKFTTPGLCNDPIHIAYKTTPHIVIAPSDTVYNPFSYLESETVYNTITKQYLLLSNILGDKLLIAELRIDNTKIIDDSYLESCQWIKCGELIHLKADSNLVLFSEGDYFYGEYEALRVYPYSSEDVNQLTEIVSGKICSRINLDARTDRNRHPVTPTVSPTNFNLFNPVYNLENNYFTFSYIKDSDIIDRTYKNSILWTNTKIFGNEIDDWGNIQSTALDLNGDCGLITALKQFNNNLYCFLESGISLILYNESVQVSATDGVPIELANSLKVQGKRYLTLKLGCNDSQSITCSPYSMYFIDGINRGFYAITKQSNAPTDIGLLTGMKSWGINNLSKKWNCYYDVYQQEIILSNGTESISYSDISQLFLSILSYKGTYYPFSINGRVVLDNTDSLWLKNNLSKTEFFGYDLPIEVTYKVGLDLSTDKIFSTVEYLADSFYDDEYLSEDSFNYIRAYNEYQDTDLVSLAYNDSRLKKKFRTWRIDIPRHKEYVNGGLVHRRDRIRNPWCYINLKYTDHKEGVWKEIQDPDAYFKITCASNNINYGKVIGGGTYAKNTKVTLKAVPKDGYRLKYWLDDHDNINLEREITVTTNAHYKAIFEIILYTITLASNIEGAGTLSGGGSFKYKSTTTLKAVANTGYKFLYWNDGNTNPIRDIAVISSITYTAYFIALSDTYTVSINVNNSNAGTVETTNVPEDGIVLPNTLITIKAIPKSGYSFAYWSDCNTESERTITVTENINLTATFIDLYTTFHNFIYTYDTGSLSPSGKYEVKTVSDIITKNYNFIGGCTEPYTLSTPVLIKVYAYATTAAPGTLSSSTSYSPVKTLNVSLVYVLYDTIGNNTTSTTKEYTVRAYTGYGLLYVSLTLKLTGIASNECVITTKAYPETYGTVTGGGKYTVGTNITLTAIPSSSEYEFVSWTLNNSVVSKESSYSITTSENALYTAVFRKKLEGDTKYDYIAYFTESNANCGSMIGIMCRKNLSTIEVSGTILSTNIDSLGTSLTKAFSYTCNTTSSNPFYFYVMQYYSAMSVWFPTTLPNWSEVKHSFYSISIKHDGQTVDSSKILLLNNEFLSDSDIANLLELYFSTSTTPSKAPAVPPPTYTNTDVLNTKPSDGTIVKIAEAGKDVKWYQYNHANKLVLYDTKVTYFT